MMEEHDELAVNSAPSEPEVSRPTETQSKSVGDYDTRLAKLETDIAALPERMAKVFKEVNPRPTPKKTDADKVDTKADTAKETIKPTGGKNRTFADRWFGR